tara:strand:+ start:5235 stop:5687 length:453 start_codon:yes stop_codon:yes gene_type:complete
MIEKAIYNILKNDTNLMNLRIYFGTLPQVSTNDNGNDEPYIVFFRNGTIPNDSKTGNAIGVINNKSGRSTLDEATIQCNIFARDAEQVSTFSQQVRDALDRVSGTFNGVVVQSIQFTNEITMFEFNDTYNTKGLYQISQYYSCRVEPVYL